MQLQENPSAFESAGISLVAMTYDAPEVQARFVERTGLNYPLVSDVDATTVRALGILNEEYAPGHRAYGIPYPGIFVIDRDGTIVGKLFLDGYTIRIDADAVLAYALDVLE